MRARAGDGRVVSLVYKKYVSEQTSRIPEYTSNVVYVTDLVSCHQKYHMRRLYPELVIGFEPQLILGSLVHEGIEKILRDNGFITEYKIEKQVQVNGTTYTLKGRVDAYNPDTKEVVEIKTARALQGDPSEHHVYQLNIYLNLLDSPKGYLVYITPDKVVEYAVERTQVNIENEVSSLLKNEKHPRYAWECKYCPFYKLCPYSKVE